MSSETRKSKNYFVAFLLPLIVILLVIGGGYFASKYITPSLTDAVNSSLEPETDRFIKINQYTSDALAIMPEIDETAAKRIVDYRNANGDIRDFGEFLKVSGIPPANAETIKPFISYEPNSPGK